MTSNTQLIALSAGGDDKELASHGVGIEHIEELMVRMTMRLLREGHRIAYGGTIGIPDQTLTEALIQVTQAWQSEEMAKFSDINNPETWPLVNYAAWPFREKIAAETRANLVGICNFRDIDPPTIDKAYLKQLYTAASDPRGKFTFSPEMKLNAARALTEMRLQSSLDTHLRIVWGGKIRGSSGWLPGILEEVGYSLAHQKPVLILGGFGGCASIMANYLLDIRASWPAQLAPQSSADPERDALATPEERERLQSRFEEIQQHFRTFRDQLHNGSEILGTSAGRLVEALSSQSTQKVIDIASTMAEVA